MSVFVIPGQVPEVHCDIAEPLVDQRHIGQGCRTHRDILFLLLYLCTVEVCVELRITLLFGEMFKAKILHDLIQWDGIE